MSFNALFVAAAVAFAATACTQEGKDNAKAANATEAAANNAGNATSNAADKAADATKEAAASAEVKQATRNN